VDVIAEEEFDETDQTTGLGTWAQLGIGLLVMLGGGVVTAGMVLSQDAQEQTAPALEPTPVEAISVSLSEYPVTVQTTGTVVAAQQINVVPQVQGKITYVSDKLKPGGRFNAGEVMARIDRRDYALAVEQQKSNVQQAEVNLALEQGRQETAQREWALLGNSGEPPALAARGPQLKATELALQSAKSGLRTAELNLERTTLRAPFNAIVLTESVDLGQVVGAQTNAATLSGTDTLWVQVSVPVERLGNIDIPGANATVGSAATITQELGATQIVREGQVLQLSGQLDPQSRTATVIVEIADPLNVKAAAQGEMPGLPMLPGAFVNVTLTGQPVSNVVKLPRVAVKENRYVWLADGERMIRQDIQVGWGSAEDVFVTAGLDAGDQVITTSVSFPIEGAPISVQAPASAALNTVEK
ncbi:MAG: efflux RND transporter periplasmic adaptor subunit, partial [Myxococcota bacterium]